MREKKFLKSDDKNNLISTFPCGGTATPHWNLSCLWFLNRVVSFHHEVSDEGGTRWY